MAFDLNALDVATPSEKPFDLEILDPFTDKPTGLFIQVLGEGSTVYREFNRRASNEAIKRNFELQRKAKDIKAPTVEEMEGRASKLLAACTVGWFTKTPGEKIDDPAKIEKAIKVDGQVLEFSPEHAERIYDDPRFIKIREQVDKAITDLGNFTKG